MDAAHTTDTEIEAALEWLRFTHPVSEHFGAEVRRTDLSGKRLAGWMHLLPDTILTLMPFVEAGASVRVGACNPDSTDPRVVDYRSFPAPMEIVGYAAAAAAAGARTRPHRVAQAAGATWVMWPIQTRAFVSATSASMAVITLIRVSSRPSICFLALERSSW